MIKTTVIIDPTGKEPIPQITVDDIGELFLWTKSMNSLDNRRFNPCLLTFEALVSLSEPESTWGSGIQNTLEKVNDYMRDGSLIVAPKGYTIQITQE